MFTWTLARAAEHPALAQGQAPSGFLSERETELLAGLRFPARRLKWLLGRWAMKRLLHEALADELGSAPSATRLTVENHPSGAPFAELDGAPLGWAISISHRGDLGLAALCREPGLALGVDLEIVAPRDAALWRQFFTPAEQAAIERAGTGAARRVALTWSAKESVLKALDLGLRLDTRTIEVGGETGGPAPPGWQRLAVTLASGQTPTVYWRDEGAFVLTAALLTV